MSRTEAEVIPYESSPRSDLSVARDPAAIVDEARRAAQVLKDVISKKDKPVKFNGEQYLEFEDWQTVAKFYGVTAKAVETQYVEFGEVRGFKAKAVAVAVASGVELSGAESMCLNDEDHWSSRAEYDWETVDGKRERKKIGERPVPLFQLMSMAQTRACAKVLRNIFAWVVVLAGYKATPAEEMTGAATDTNNQQQQGRASKPQGKVISENQAKRLFAICKGAGLQGDKYKEFLKAHGFDADREVTVEKYDEIVRKAQEHGNNSPAA
jgi:hypothetical protein